MGTAFGFIWGRVFWFGPGNLGRASKLPFAENLPMPKSVAASKKRSTMDHIYQKSSQKAIRNSNTHFMNIHPHQIYYPSTSTTRQTDQTRL
jgi:hypothetical protein